MTLADPSPIKVIFKYDQHAANISKKLQTFYEQNEFFDTVLIAGKNNDNIQGHRVILCAFSEYFVEKFRGDQSALKENVVELKEIEASTLKLIIDFMYSGSIEFSLEMVGEILRTASSLKIKSLVDFCRESIEENIDFKNALNYYRLAYELRLTGLKTKALEYIYFYFEEISQEKELLMLSENELKDLLFNENPHGDFEEDVYLVMVAWINFDKSNREHLVFQLLSMVRFQALTPKFIVENRKSVCRTVESYELICSWLQWHLCPETRSNDQKSFSFKPRKKLALAQCWKEGQIKIQTFNPKQNSWSIEIETHLPSKNKIYRTVVFDGKLIVAGTGRKESLEYLNLRTSEWNDIPQMQKARNILNMTELNGNLYVLGSISVRKVSDSTNNFHTETFYFIKIYNFSIREWHDFDTQPPYQLSASIQMLTDDRILHLIDYGNGFVQSYNIASKIWTSRKVKKNLLDSFYYFSDKECLYFVGTYNSDTKEWDDSVRRYNVSNDSWCEMASLPTTFSKYMAKTYTEFKNLTWDTSLNTIKEFVSKRRKTWTQECFLRDLDIIHLCRI